MNALPNKKPKLNLSPIRKEDVEIEVMESEELEEEEDDEDVLLLEPTLQGSEPSSSRENSFDLSFKKIKEQLWYACSKCFRSFGEIGLLRDHLRQQHGVSENDRVEHPGNNSFLTIGAKSAELNMGPNLGERHLSVLSSKIHGRGLFSGNFIPKGEMIIEYTGEIITRPCALRRQHYYDQHKLDHYIMKVGKIIIDATVFGNCSKFINNSCDPNCFAEKIEIFGKSRVFIFSTRNILANEELTYDYQFTSDELIPCNCGSVKCRRFLNCNLHKLKLNEDVIETLIKSLG